MATIGPAGGALDVNAIVSQLMTIERQPLQALQKTISGIQTKLSALGKLQGQLAAFQDAARELTRSDTWNVAKATSTDDTAIKATASTGAVAGAYDVAVDRLAQRQTLATARLAGADTVIGGGTLRIQFGTHDADGGTFTADPDRPEAAIAIAADATVEQVRNAINAAGVGVTASVIADGDGVRLLVRGNDTGAANSVQILVDDDDADGTDGAGLSQLAYDPLGAEGAGRNLAQTQQAQDAAFRVTGIDLTSATNKVSGVIEGVTLELRKDGGTTVGIDVSSDADAMRKSVEKFVSAYNDLNRTINDLTRFDPATKTAGPLQGNSTVLSVQRQIRSVLQDTMDGDLTRISDAGLQFQRDGSLQVNQNALNAALADPDALQALFATSATDPADNGLARRLDSLITSMLGTEGAITGATSTLRDRQDSVENQQDRLENRLSLVEARLRKQYTSLDQNLSKLQSASSFLASRFDG